MTEKPQVLIMMGSENDLPTMDEAAKILAEFGIAHRVHVASAHRSPDKVRELVREAEGAGVKVIIAGAGFAAHLAGVVAAHTTLPVVGVPLESSTLAGLDSLLSTVQMPAGIPVATVAIGRGGAKNAGILAAQILALSDPGLQKKLTAYRKNLAEGIESKDRELERSR